MPEARGERDDTAEDRYLVFTLGADDYALAADVVRELLRPPPVTRVPGAPSALSGLANLRGIPLPVLDLRRIVTPDQEPGPAPTRLVVAEASEPVGLLVDRVVAFSGGEALPETEAGAQPRRLSLPPGSGTARLIDLPTLIADAFPRRVRASGRVAGPSARDVEAVEMQAERIALVSFRACGRSYALRLEGVAEVMAFPPDVMPVPRAGEAALGVVALRGHVLPVLSLAALLGAGRDASKAAARVIVTRVGGTEIGLAVDSLGPILRLAPDAIDPVPAALRRGGATAVDAICRIDAAGTLVSVLSLARLLETATVNLMPERNPDTETPVAAGPDAPTEQFVVFELAGERYGVPVAAVREVLRVPDTMARLPRSPDLVVGAIDVRGTVLAVIDQRRRFGLPPGAADARRRILVLDGGVAGLLVDGVSRLLRLPLTAIHSAPDFSGDAGAAVDRVATLESGDLLPLIDARALIAGVETAIQAVGRRPDGRKTKAMSAA